MSLPVVYCFSDKGNTIVGYWDEKKLYFKRNEFFYEVLEQYKFIPPILANVIFPVILNVSEHEINRNLHLYQGFKKSERTVFIGELDIKFKP